MCLNKTLMDKSDLKKKNNHNYSNNINRPLETLKLKKLSRKIVKSAKVNLNRYWNKFEEMFSNDSHQILNNQIYQPIETSEENSLNNKIELMTDQSMVVDEVTEFLSKNYFAEKNIRRGKYKHFKDDSLYHGVNLDLYPIDTCPCSCHAHQPVQQPPSSPTASQLAPAIDYQNRFSVYVMQNIDEYGLTVAQGSNYYDGPIAWL